MQNAYVLEAQRHIPPTFTTTGVVYKGIFMHEGYMDKVFTTKQQANRYYNQHNPHLRALNEHDTWRSDWDPATRLRYVVRSYHGEIRTLPSWENKAKQAKQANTIHAKEANKVANAQEAKGPNEETPKRGELGEKKNKC
jgi:hypothetical protein